MYFPGDPLLALDPIFNAAPGDAGQRLVAAFDPALTVPEFALGYRFDFVLRGCETTSAKL
jgi:protocatechuate 3,4-dioxygenase beta subunit